MKRLNNKEVMERVKEHIMESYESHEEFREEVENQKNLMRVGNDYMAGVNMTQDGFYLCFCGQAREFLKETLEETDEEAAKYSDSQVWETYKHLIGKGTEKLMKQ